jgi:hypothetical protein
MIKTWLVHQIYQKVTGCGFGFIFEQNEYDLTGRIDFSMAAPREIFGDPF